METKKHYQKKPILIASNSSGKQEFFFDYHHYENMVSATMVGKYNEKDIQIDFDSIDKKKLSKIIKRLKVLKRFIK